ncbi:hypothetical protein VOLCADRAFT_98634 [Volvox carteri f. nagariensis]|uniref:Uncharacterized protein n=1 Tax=Volvox carteri f. nagariensis TaxID=3068 RepID=D8UFV8_VOLCA|nr:uncharacterized protein VOLCADRAFT_98634 [Volvox carteri f. nagariensis]EFJ41404.1 hypothetical protein VOLCADRAFT_98634 [Volvox carteri f. nagariensis]|eukprot:XP_002957510.1 hypothetical protein VOLCADRAFT_98634 [Volvox carteri f. nagariensis]
MLQDDGELYVRAAHHRDLVILRCLRRLDCPWGPGVFSRAVYDKVGGGTLEVLQWLHAEGCPLCGGEWRMWRVQRQRHMQGNTSTSTGARQLVLSDNTAYASATIGNIVFDATTIAAIIGDGNAAGVPAAGIATLAAGAAGDHV